MNRLQSSDGIREFSKLRRARMGWLRGVRLACRRYNPEVFFPVDESDRVSVIKRLSGLHRAR